MWDDDAFKADVVEYMRRQGVTRCGLARRAGLHHNQLYRWMDEGVSLRVTTIAKIAVACDLSLDSYVRSSVLI